MWSSNKSRGGVGAAFRGCLISILLGVATANWWQNGDDSEIDVQMFGGALTRDWLYNSMSVSLQYEGCFLGYQTGDGEDGDNGCLENDSEDGTYYWYQMANCMRPQATYSLYASESSSSVGCSSSTFKESLTTTTGFADFLEVLQKYDNDNIWGNNNNNNNNNGGDDDYYNDGQNNNYDVDDLPTCEQTDYGYLGLSCSEYGDVVLRLFQDQYCLGISDSQVYDELNSINKKLKKYKNCVGAYNYGDGQDNSLGYKLIYYSDRCSTIDNSMCKNEALSGTHRSSISSSSSKSANGKSWVTKLKYVAGGMLLVASFVMFTGILFTNRRRRRALMQRKYRQNRKDRARSKSRGYDAHDGQSRKSGRSKSRNRNKEDRGGVFT